MATADTNVTELVGTAPDSLEPGVYEAQLLRVERRETQFGERLRWVFDAVDDDTGDTTETSVWSGFKTHKDTKAGSLIEALGGARPAKGERVNLKALLGRWCRLVVVAGDGDFTKVDSVMPTKRDRVSAPAPADDDDAWAEVR